MWRSGSGGGRLSASGRTDRAVQSGDIQIDVKGLWICELEARQSRDCDQSMAARTSVSFSSYSYS